MTYNQYVDAKATQKILTAARQQQAELNVADDSFGPALTQTIKRSKGGARTNVRTLGGPSKGGDDSDSDIAEDAGDVDERDFFDDIELDEENRKALEMFQNK